jgi:UPF0716 protein FxsA
MRFLFLLFITVPIVEMWVLLQVGSKIGALATIFAVFLTAALGLALLRQQGFNTLLKLNQRMENGQLPAQEIMEGVMLAVGGALLLTPGFITDAIGFACLLPFSRHLLVAGLWQRGVKAAEQGQFTYSSESHSSGFQHDLNKPFSSSSSEQVDTQSSSTETIDGEFRRED